MTCSASAILGSGGLIARALEVLADARVPTFVRESRNNAYMRLYLSSYQLGDHPEAFTDLVREWMRVGHHERFRRD